MKKFFLFAFAGLLALSFTSCDKDLDQIADQVQDIIDDVQNDDQNNNNPTQTDNFTITVSDITALSATVTVVPTNMNSTYYYSIIEASTFADYASSDELMTDVIAFIEYMIDMYAQYGYELSFSDFLTTGRDSYEFTDLSEETQYVAFAFKLDENKVTGAFVSTTFTTPAIVPVQTVDMGTLTESAFEDYREVDGSFIAMGSIPDEFEVGVNIFDEDFTGNFTTADLDLGYSWVWTPDMGEDAQRIVKASLVGQADAAANTATLQGYVVGENLVKYTFSFEYSTVTEEQPVALARVAQKANAKKAVKASKFYNKKLF